MKNQWILAIQEANNEKFCGIGVVCSKHFSPDQIRGRGPQAKLVKGSVPSVFSVECIEYTNEPNECDKCNQKQYTEEVYKLKKKLALVKKQKTEIESLENELLALKTAPNINICMQY